AVRRWIDSWAEWRGAGQVVWEERHWDRIGIQRLPAILELASAADVASVVGASKRWNRARERYLSMAESWPILVQSGILSRRFDFLADSAAEDFDRLKSLLQWLALHPTSGLYLRQLPVPGLDTK